METTWLFTGRNKKNPFPNGTLQKAYKAALRKSGIRKKASIHTLRHSYATHLLEHGIDVVTIQKTLGHRYASITTIYIHLTRTRLNTLHTTVDQAMSRL
jgi:integrase/recombinase XerD